MAVNKNSKCVCTWFFYPLFLTPIQAHRFQPQCPLWYAILTILSNTNTIQIRCSTIPCAECLPSVLDIAGSLTVSVALLFGDGSIWNVFECHWYILSTTERAMNIPSRYLIVPTELYLRARPRASSIRAMLCLQLVGALLQVLPCSEKRSRDGSCAFLRGKVYFRSCVSRSGDKNIQKFHEVLIGWNVPCAKRHAYLHLSETKTIRMAFKISRVQRLSAVIGISLSFFVAEISGKRILDYGHCWANFADIVYQSASIRIL